MHRVPGIGYDSASEAQSQLEVFAAVVQCEREMSIVVLSIERLNVWICGAIIFSIANM
jgi:hypothetical protein